MIVDRDPRSSISGYALTVLDVLRCSRRYDYQVLNFPLTFRSPQEQILAFLNNLDTDAIIYSWYPGDDQWLYDDVMLKVRKPQFVLGGHHHIPEFTVPCHQWSAWYDTPATDRVTPLTRPVMHWPDIQYHEPRGMIKIGSFGLGLANKNFAGMIDRVNRDFQDNEVELNLHMSYTPRTFKETNEQAQICRQAVAPNVKLNLTFNYLPTSRDVARFLNGNDLNIFMYDDQPHLQVTSSALDHALSARKPIALKRSSLFSHMDEVEGIWVETSTLPEIMARGIEPLEPVYQHHSPEQLLACVEPYLDRYII